MILIALIIFLLAYPVLLGYRDYLIFPVRLEVSKPWHELGFIVRACTVLLLLAPYPTFIPLYCFYLWTVYDLVTGVGTTALIDKYTGKYSMYIKVVGLILSTVLVYKF